jgi:lysyl-tRNA synthetase class I
MANSTQRRLAAFLFLMDQTDWSKDYDEENDPNLIEPVPGESERYLAMGVQFDRCLSALRDALVHLPSNATPEEIQFVFYEVAKPIYGEEKADLKEWFRELYLLWGEKETGPRWGIFVQLMGIQNFVDRLSRRWNEPIMWTVW